MSKRIWVGVTCLAVAAVGLWGLGVYRNLTYEGPRPQHPWHLVQEQPQP